MPERELDDLRPARESSLWILVVLVVLVLGAGAVWWRWTTSRPRRPKRRRRPPRRSPRHRPGRLPPVAPAEPQNPVDTTADADLPKLDDADAKVRVRAQRTARREGGRLPSCRPTASCAASSPPSTTCRATRRPRACGRCSARRKRFTVSGSKEAQTISLDNGARYTPFVLFAESVNPQRAAALYAEALSAVPAGVRGARLSGPLLQRPPGGGDRPPAAGARTGGAAAGEAGRDQGRGALRAALGALRVRRPGARIAVGRAEDADPHRAWSTSAG